MSEHGRANALSRIDSRIGVTKAREANLPLPGHEQFTRPRKPQDELEEEVVTQRRV